MKLEDYLEEFKKDMLQKFIDHDEKWKDYSVIREGFNFSDMNENGLREEISYHYAKWLYRGVVKKDLPEKDTLTNLANMCLLLWIKLKVME
ncbi:MAG: hypothetical protein ACYDAP_00080 [Thermoplasmataceae archaeon]